MPFVTMDDDSDDTMDPSMGETMDTNMDVPVQNGSMGSNNESTGTNKAESVNDIWFTTLDDQEVTIDDDDDESTINDNDDDSLSWISVEEKNPTTWSKIKNILIVIGILGLIAGGSIAAVYLAPSEKEIKLLDNLQDKEIQADIEKLLETSKDVQSADVTIEGFDAPGKGSQGKQSRSVSNNASVKFKMIFKLNPADLENTNNNIDVTNTVEKIVQDIIEEANPDDFDSFEKFEVPTIESVETVDPITTTPPTPSTGFTATCFALKSDSSMPNARGDEILLFKDGQKVETVLGTNQVSNEICIEDTTDADAFEIRNGGQDNVYIIEVYINGILKDIGPIWIDSDVNIDNDPYTSDCVDGTSKANPHAYTQFTIENGEINSKNCIEKPPVYSTWGEYSDCSKSCGVGNKTRERNCIGGICSRATTQDLVQSDFCNEINCPSEFTSWAEWSTCSTTCGDGNKARQRTCTAHCDNVSTESTEQTDYCKTADCTPEFSDWGSWSACSATCGDGEETRTRTCDEHCNNDSGPLSETRACNKGECPPEFSEWSTWSTCSETCGAGEQTRQRTCDNYCPHPVPEDQINETQDCNNGECQPEFSEWSTWSACSTTCGAGDQTRQRTCDNHCPTTVPDDQTNETKGCNLAECEKAVLMLSKSSNLPMVIRKNGEYDDDIDFTYDTNTETYKSCSAILNNEMYVFGGATYKRQISKVTNCALQNVGSLDFDFLQGACNTFSFGIMLCFSYATTTLRKACKSYDGTTLTTEASSTFPHGKTYALGNYKDSPFITGRDASSSGLKTEILNYQTSTWVEKDDYPFSSNRIARYATVKTDESVLIIGGYTSGGPPDRTTIIAEYKNEVWSNIGNFAQRRDTHGAIISGSAIMIVGGWPMSGSSLDTELWDMNDSQGQIIEPNLSNSYVYPVLFTVDIGFCSKN